MALSIKFFTKSLPLLTYSNSPPLSDDCIIRVIAKEALSKCQPNCCLF